MPPASVRARSARRSRNRLHGRSLGDFDGSVRWQLVAESGLTSEGVLQRLMRERPAAADVAVVIVGVNDITTDVPLAVALRHRSHIATLAAGARAGTPRDLSCAA